ncbi:MAG: hypothetical protein R3C15_04285 [Thermoleophilia bacterium]
MTDPLSDRLPDEARPMPTIRLNRIELVITVGAMLALRDALDLRGRTGKEAAIALVTGKVWTHPQKCVAHDAIDDAITIATEENVSLELAALRQELRWDLGLAQLDT